MVAGGPNFAVAAAGVQTSDLVPRMAAAEVQDVHTRCGHPDMLIMASPACRERQCRPTGTEHNMREEVILHHSVRAGIDRASVKLEY